MQTAPLDLETDSFYLVRKSCIESHLQKIHDGMAEEILITSWESHMGTACRGVNWDWHSLTELRAAVTCIGGPCLASLCRHLAQDYQSWSSGMPDLLLWRFHGEYRGEAKLVEVKGPRDRLSEQQRAWLLLLMDCGFNTEVCKVSPVPMSAWSHTLSSKKNMTRMRMEVFNDYVKSFSYKFHLNICACILWYNNEFFRLEPILRREKKDHKTPYTWNLRKSRSADHAVDHRQGTKAGKKKLVYIITLELIVNIILESEFLPRNLIVNIITLELFLGLVLKTMYRFAGEMELVYAFFYWGGSLQFLKRGRKI